MSIFNDMMSGPGWEMHAAFNADLFDFHPVGGDEVENIRGLIESRSGGQEIEAGRYDVDVEVLRVHFKNNAATGIAKTSIELDGAYITEAGQTVRYYYQATAADNGGTRLMVFTRHVGTEDGNALGRERRYR